jgi:hypothetical protein
MKRLLIVTLLVTATFGGQASGQESLCTTPGTAVFRDVPQTRIEILPSVHKEMSGIGRLAHANGCSIRVICVNDAPTEGNQISVTNRACYAARGAIIAYEENSTRRRALTDNIKVVKVNASSTWQAGTLYVELR